MAETPAKKGVVDYIIMVFRVIKDLIDLITGKSSGAPIPNPDGGAGASGQQSKIDTLQSKIDSSPTGINITPDGGIDVSGFNSGKEVKK